MGVASVIGFALSSLLVQGIGARQQQRGIRESVEEQNRLAALEQQELERQIGEEDEIAQEQKSDRIREADRSFASMVAALAEQGGLSGGNLPRGAAEIAFSEGIDLARIEGNRTRRIGALRSKQQGAQNRALSFQKAATRDSQATGLRFLSTGLSISGSAASDIADIQAAKKRTS